MTLFRVQLRKAVSEGGISAKWSNIYYVEADDVSDAASKGVELWTDCEQGFHRPFVFCYEVYASDLAPDTDVYTVLALDAGDQRGGLTSDSGQILPLFNVVRDDLGVVGGRPSRKFYRPMLGEADQTGGVINNSALTAAILGGTAALILKDFTRDESGNTFNSTSVKGITSRRLGKLASTAVPTPPPEG